MTDNLSSRSQMPDWEALARYHAGESPAEEARLVATWLAANAQDAALLAMLDEVVERAIGVEQAAATLPDASPHLDVEAALRAVKARRDAEVVAAPPATIRDRSVPFDARSTRTRRTRVWWMAGGLAAAAGLALFLRSSDADRDVTSTPPVVASGAQLLQAGRELATPVGHRDSVRLPDGTRVQLAPGSRLVVAGDFGGIAREVTLEGQAQFTVVHDEARPFTVRAGEALVRDIGTVFAVRTEAARIVVDVTEGRVALRSATAASATDVELAAGDRGTIGSGDAPSAERDVVTAEDVQWSTTGALVYRAAPISTVASDLKRWYGLDLRVAAPLAARRLTATFTGESADEVVRVVALALAAQATRNGDTVTLRPATDSRR